MFRLDNRVALVTGASGGLGADAAMAYAEYGADVAILARRKEKLDAVAGKIREKTGRMVLAVECDVTSEESVRLAVGAVLQQFGGIDILLNNAGLSRRETVENTSLEDWNYMMAVNVGSVFLMCKYVIPHMRKAGYGKIVNISSNNAFVGEKVLRHARQTYSASKRAVLGLTMALATGYAQDGITVNAVCPGLFESEMTAAMYGSERFISQYNLVTPAGRPGRKGELNGTIIYLSSEASSYVTGQEILVEGGFSLV